MPPLLNGLNQMPQTVEQHIHVPVSDVQVIALLAVWCPGENLECKVHKAQDVFAQAFKSQGRFKQMIDKIKRGDDE